MAEGEGKGGYRRPSNPAPVSGPAQLSKRTDGGPSQPVRVAPGGAYGERQESIGLQQAAPVSASPGGTAAAPAGGGDITAGLVGLGEPSQQPDVPVTAGADAGPGPGLAALNLPTPQGEDMQHLVKYLPVFEFMANRPGASAAARNLVRSIKSYT